MDSRQTYQDVFDGLIAVFGQSVAAKEGSHRIASVLATLIGDHDPRGWRWGRRTTYLDPTHEKVARGFEAFESSFFEHVRKLLPLAIDMRDCVPFYDEGLDDLVKALQRFERPTPGRAADPRSEWHATADLFAKQIEKQFGKLPRTSVSSPLILAVQSLLDMVGQRVEADTIRKALGAFKQKA